MQDFLTKLFNENILFNDLELIKEGVPFSKQIYEYKEDLLQVKNNKSGLLLDVGWLPELSSLGAFKVVVIKNHDWEKPLFKTRVRSIDSLKKVLAECKVKYDF